MSFECIDLYENYDIYKRVNCPYCGAFLKWNYEKEEFICNKCKNELVTIYDSKEGYGKLCFIKEK